jgi:hypothetical protein
MDLSSIGARIDDRLRMALVTCPMCATTHVRRSVQWARGWRRARRAVLALVVLGVQIGLLALMTTLVLYGAACLQQTVAALWRGRTPDLARDFSSFGWEDLGAMVILLPVAMLSVAGLWAGLSFAHHRALPSMVGFLLWISLWLLLSLLAELLAERSLPSAESLGEIMRAYLGLLEGLPAFAVAFAFGRSAASSRRAWRRRRYALAIARRRALPTR